MLQCQGCGATLDLTMAACPSCGAEVPLGRLTGILGLVCRRCDAYNEPAALNCVACGQPLGAMPVLPDLAAPPAARRTPASARPAAPVAAVRAGIAPFVAEPEPGPRARLLVERGEVAPGTEFALAGEEVLAGRSQGAVTFPSDPCLAAHHATFLTRGEGHLAVRDEGAPGGVFVRIPRGAPVALRAGSLFAVGDRLLRFAGAVPAAPPPPPDGTLRLGAPRPDGPAVLVEEWLEGGVGGRVHLRAGPSVTVGRAGCSVNLGDDPYLSQAHAEIVIDPGGATSLRDLGSSNGTFLRIPPGGEAELQDGDELRLGREVLRVELR